MSRAADHVGRLTAALLARGYIRIPAAKLRELATKSEASGQERYQVRKRQYRYDHTQGPMFYLGQQIVKAMQDAGFPAKVHQCYRSPEEQQEMYAQGRTEPGKIITKALPYNSAHQFYEAVDIIHPNFGWDVSSDYWEALAACTKVVAQRFGVDLEHGHHWRFVDSAHIELADWRSRRDALKVSNGGRHEVPDARQLWQRFHEVLPRVAKRFEKDRGGPPPGVANEEALASAVQWMADYEATRRA